MLAPVTILSTLLFVSFTSAISPAPSSIPALPSGWSYAGCMTGGRGSSRSPDRYQDSDDMTIRQCVDICAPRGYTYAGLQNTNECTCNNVLIFDQSTRDSDCEDPCDGDRSQPCGGDKSFMTVLRYTAPQAPAPAPIPATSKPPPVVVVVTPTRSVIVAPTTPPVVPPSSSTPNTTPNQNPNPNPIPNPNPNPASSTGTPNPALSSPSNKLSTPRVPNASSSGLGVSTTSSGPPIEITQYLRPLPSSPSGPGAGPNQFSGTGLQLGGSSGTATVPTVDRFADRTIVLPGPTNTAPPRLRDESQLIVFGTYANSAVEARVEIQGMVGSLVLGLSCVLALWL